MKLVDGEEDAWEDATALPGTPVSVSVPDEPAPTSAADDTFQSVAPAPAPTSTTTTTTNPPAVTTILEEMEEEETATATATTKTTNALPQPPPPVKVKAPPGADSPAAVDAPTRSTQSAKNVSPLVSDFSQLDMWDSKGNLKIGLALSGAAEVMSNEKNSRVTGGRSHKELEISRDQYRHGRGSI